ncbi:hypothetical protein AB1I68_00185 [Paenibacillus pabuli]|uniref:hypothetical protein n=1 Tax=Paenibacillus pabuli TaxID=1472 RepID=UPI003458374F
MELTKILIKSLSAGELQRLACDLLPQLYTDWQGLQMSGGVEGTSKTRKGTPDAWCERENGTLVYIQATADPSKGKIYEDLEKSILKLKSINKNNDALCIAFLSFDPQSDEIEKCKKYAKDNNCSFDYYSNFNVSGLLDENYPELKEKYLNLESSLESNDDDYFSIDPILIEKIMMNNNSNYDYDELYIRNTFDALNDIDKDSRFVLFLIVNKSNSGNLDLNEIKNKAIEQINEVKFYEIIISLENNNYIRDDMPYGENSFISLENGSLYDGTDYIEYRLNNGIWNLDMKGYLFKQLRHILNNRNIFKRILVSLESVRLSDYSNYSDYVRNEDGYIKIHNICKR